MDVTSGKSLAIQKRFLERDSNSILICNVRPVKQSLVSSVGIHKKNWPATLLKATLFDKAGRELSLLIDRTVQAKGERNPLISDSPSG
ncbi:MAG: hypothetical protein Tsb009_32360 [Planctomycetaceae bacterium]